MVLSLIFFGNTNDRLSPIYYHHLQSEIEVDQNHEIVLLK